MQKPQPYVEQKSASPQQAQQGDSPGPTHVRYLVLAWLCVAATIAYICRQSIGVAESSIRLETGLSKPQMGLVMSAFFWSYALSQIPTGWLGHRFGSRRMLPLFAAFWSVATGAMGLAIGMPLLLASRIANGISQAGLFPSAVNTVSRWFPKNQRATANGAMGAFMGVGGATGAALTGVLLSVIDWRWIFLIYSLVGLVWARAFYAWFREWPSDHPGVNAAELKAIGAGKEGGSKPHDDYIPTPWLAMAASPAMWWICGQQFCRAAGQIFFASWFATYLQEARGVTILQSGLLTMLPIVGRVVGGLLGGIVSDWVFTRTGSIGWARKGVAGISLALCAALVLVALTVENATFAVLLISLGATFAAFAGACAYTITIDMGGSHVPTVFSTMNMIGNFGAAIFPLVAALLREVTGSWNTVLVLFAGLYIAASLFWFLLKPQGTIFEQSWAASSESSA